MPPEDDKQYIWDEDVKNWVESEPPYPSWHVAEGRWQAPVNKPDDGKEYTWSGKLYLGLQVKLLMI